MAATEYVVLRKTKAATALSPNTSSNQAVREQWEIVAGNVEATSADGAVRKCCADKALGADDTAILVAVPLRSWQPTKVKTETTTRFKIGPA